MRLLDDRKSFIAVFAEAQCPSVGRSVRPSVCLSVCLSRSIILVLDPGADTQFQRELFQRGRKIQWVEKFCDFRLKSPSVSETVRDRPMVAMGR